MTLTCLTAVLALLIALASAQVTQCAPDGSPQLRFVAQLSVSGCALTVHDTGANHTKHLVVEPLMCVTGDLHSVLPRFDPIIQQTYVSVPVMLRDDAMLAEVERQLRHLSPESVKFATVTDISVSTDTSSVIQALWFVWNPEESVGLVRLGCIRGNHSCLSTLVVRLQAGHMEALHRVILTATLTSSVVRINLKYRLTMENARFNYPALHKKELTDLPPCKLLRFVRSIRLANCTARVHQRLDMKGHFLIEPLLCHNITSMSNESVLYDYSTGTHYLKLDLVLQDDVTVDAVRTQLADLEPRSVAFMRLWRAQSVVASALSGRFRIGPLMVSADWRSAQVRVHCRSEDECLQLRHSISDHPFHLWSQIKWTVTSLVDTKCRMVSSMSRFVSAFSTAEPSDKDSVVIPVFNSERDRIALCHTKVRISSHWSNYCWFSSTPDGRQFVVIQQRVTGSVSFQRNWTDYERGFGDWSDFWIGLSAIYSLSINGATLRVEMKLWNGIEMHAEYAGFKVGDAATNYTMTYREMLRDRSSVSWNAMRQHYEVQFSTMDRDNDRWIEESCSTIRGQCGWWFNNCQDFNPNGLFPTRETPVNSYMYWYSGSELLSLREVRLMLQI